MSSRKAGFGAIFRKELSPNRKTGLDNMHGMGYKKRERFCTAGRAARHRRETPLCAYAKQLQKGDHKNGYF